MKKPERIVLGNGTVKYMLDGKLHREDGPAIAGIGGNKKWFINDKLHREDGPAVVSTSGYKSWWVNDKLHRTDGPAIIHGNGTTEYHFNGTQVSEGDFQYEVIKANEAIRLENGET
jgi:hypothetical protein